MNKKIVSSCLLMLSAPFVCAEDTHPSLYSDVELYSDSDDLKINQWSVGYQQSEGIFSHLHENEPEQKLLWSFKATRNNIDQADKTDYSGHAITATLGQKFNSNFSAALSVGDSRLSSNQARDITKDDSHLTTYGLQAKAKLNEQVTVHATHGREFLFNNSIIEGDSDQILHGDNTGLGIYWRPHDKWRVESKIHHQSLSDGNSSDKVSGALLYGISSGWPWIWTGVTAEKLEYEESRGSYWTPEDYQSVGLTFDSSFPVNDKLSMSFGANISRSKEDENPSGTGYSVSTGAGWQVSENISLNAKGYLLESTQKTSGWKQDGVNLSVKVKSF